MPRKIRHSPTQLRDALNASGGVISAAARLLGMSPRSLKRRIAADPAVVLSNDEIRDQMAGMAMMQVMTLGRGGDFRAIKWFLQRFAPERGYGVHRARSRVRHDVHRSGPLGSVN